MDADPYPDPPEWCRSDRIRLHHIPQHWLKWSQQSSPVGASVADPHWIKCGSGSSIFCQCGSGSIQIQGFDIKKLEKFTAKIKFIFFWSKITIYLSLGPHKGCPSYMRGLHPSKENIQHLDKTWIFFTFVDNFFPPGSGSGFVFPVWIRIQPNQNECGSGYATHGL